MTARAGRSRRGETCSDHRSRRTGRPATPAWYVAAAATMPSTWTAGSLRSRDYRKEVRIDICRRPSADADQYGRERTSPLRIIPIGPASGCLLLDHSFGQMFRCGRELNDLFSVDSHAQSRARRHQPFTVRTGVRIPVGMPLRRGSVPETSTSNAAPCCSSRAQRIRAHEK
jgi:hypothetical protein